MGTMFAAEQYQCPPFQEVALLTSDLEHIAKAIIAPFGYPPEVLSWDGRFFVNTGLKDEDIMVYREVRPTQILEAV